MPAVQYRPASYAVVFRFHAPSLRYPRSRRLFPAAGSLVCGALISLVGACGQPRAVERPPEVAALTIGLTSGTVDVRQIVQSLTTLRLVGTGPDGRPTPGLLQSWSASEDGRIWDFELKPNVHRHDGAPVTAEDVAALVRREMGDEPPAGLVDIARLEVVNPVRLRIHLHEPSSLLLEALTLMRAVPAGPFMPGAGPITAESSPTLPASPTTTADSTITSVVVRRYESPRAAWSALMRDEIDLLHEVSGEARPFLEQAPGIEVRPFLRPFVITLGLNVRHPVLRHRDVRLALNHAVDRDDLLAKDFGGRGLVAATHVWPRHWAAEESLAPHAFDSVLARRLLDGAGLRVVDRSDGRPSRFRIVCLIMEDLPRVERVALRLRRSFADVGVDLVLEPVSPITLADRLRTGDFETFLVPVMSGHGPNALYHMWGQHNLTRFVDHGYKAAAPAVEQVRRAHTDEQMQTAMRALQRVLFDDPPAVYLVWEETARAIGRRFVVPSSPGRDILSSLPQWRLQTVEREESP